MFETLLAGKPKPPPDVAFNGEIPWTEFIDGDTLASVVGLTAGTSINSDSPWLSFNYYGKKLFVPKLPIRQGTSWLALYNAGVVHGTGAIGTKPAQNTGVLQNKRVTIADKTYIVRLLKGTGGGDTYVLNASDAGTDKPLGFDSEWNRLFYLITVDSKIVSYTGPKIPNPYTPADLGLSPATGNASTFRVVQEIRDTLNGNYVARGTLATVTGVQPGRTHTDTSTAQGWTPCLELVP